MLGLGVLVALITGLVVVAPRELDRDTTPAALTAAGQASDADTADRDETVGPERDPFPDPAPFPDPDPFPPPTFDDPSSPGADDPLGVPGLPEDELFDDELLRDFLDESFGECLDVALAFSALLLEPLVGAFGEEALGPETLPDQATALETLPPELQGPAAVIVDVYADYGAVVEEHGPLSAEALAALEALDEAPAAEALEAFEAWFVANC